MWYNHITHSSRNSMKKDSFCYYSQLNKFGRPKDEQYIGVGWVDYIFIERKIESNMMRYLNPFVLHLCIRRVKAVTFCMWKWLQDIGLKIHKTKMQCNVFQGLSLPTKNMNKEYNFVFLVTFCSRKIAGVIVRKNSHKSRKKILQPSLYPWSNGILLNV